MDFLQDFFEWAWNRHHNPLSWYIRPVFLIPYCVFAYRRSMLGLIATVILLATSMFWFPAPATPDPQAIAFLRMEWDYLTGEWTLAKYAMTATIPLVFVTLGWAFWRRAWGIGLAAINLATASKLAWSFYHGGESAWTVVWPAMLGLAACNVAVVWLIRRASIQPLPGSTAGLADIPPRVP